MELLRKEYMRSIMRGAKPNRVAKQRFCQTIGFVGTIDKKVIGVPKCIMISLGGFDTMEFNFCVPRTSMVQFYHAVDNVYFDDFGLYPAR